MDRDPRLPKLLSRIGLEQGQRVHGGARAGALSAHGLDPAEVLDFSVNVNPYGPCPAVLEAIRTAKVDFYPDPTASEVRRTIAERTGTPVESVVFGAGAADLLWTLARVLLSGGGRALIVEPTFSEFRAAALAAGGALEGWRASPENGLALDFAEIERAAKRGAVEVLYLCAPSTPAGIAVPLSEVAALAKRLEETVVLLDESFLSLSDQSHEATLPLPANVVRLRSMTKEHAIPGLRAGYLLAPPPLAHAVEASRPAWSTSSVAQAAALASLGAETFVSESRERLRADRQATVAELERLGLRPLPSIAPYLVFEVGDAAKLQRKLLTHRILVRDCASFGLPGMVRVAARPAPERARLFLALEEELR